MAGGTTPVHPVLFALRETIRECNIPLQPFFDLIDANVQDQTVSHYTTSSELDAYCRLSAAPVGRMVLAVFRMDDPRARQLSDDVCIGLQLANHAQDVARDAKMGRRYLIDEDIEASGVPGAVRALVVRARSLLGSGRTLEAMAPFPLRLQLSLYRLGGLAICDGIERLDFRTDESRPRITSKEKVAIILRAFVDALRRNGAIEQIETA
jgi:phytoene/squalene synthetase